jgi:hypothetical protein
MDDKSKIRKIIKTTLNEFLNENISFKINNLIDDYRENIGCTINQINRGHCDEFAYDLLQDVGGESDDVFLLATNPDYSEDYAIDFSDENNKRYYKKFTKFGSESQKLMKLDHVWLYYKGKHYDAETVNGVNDFVELPFFQRILRKKRG